MNNVVKQIHRLLCESDFDFPADEPLPDDDQFGDFNKVIDKLLDSDGKLPVYAWPGGHHILYHTEDGGILCGECANMPEVLHADKFDRQWWIVAYDVLDEGDVVCDHCGNELHGPDGGGRI